MPSSCSLEEDCEAFYCSRNKILRHVCRWFIVKMHHHIVIIISPFEVIKVFRHEAVAHSCDHQR